MMVSSMSAQETENRPQQEFTKIDLGGAFEVQLIEGSRHHVKIEADEELMADIKTEVSGSKLKIYVDRKQYNSSRKSSLVIEFVKLEEIKIGGVVEIESLN